MPKVEIALDVALLNIGWVVFHDGSPVMDGCLSLDAVKRSKGEPAPPRVFKNGKKDRKKRFVADTEEGAASFACRRCASLHAGLSAIVAEHGPQTVYAELSMGGQSAAAARSLCMGLAVVACLGLGDKLKIVTQHAVKKACGAGGLADAAASKAAVQACVRARWPDYVFSVKPSKFEHVADAMGVYMAGGLSGE